MCSTRQVTELFQKTITKDGNKESNLREAADV